MTRRERIYGSYSVGVIGMGYVGLVVAGVLSAKGHYVKVYDIDQNKLNQIEKGECYISEPGLDKLYDKNKIRVSKTIQEIVNESEIIFVTVGTPSNTDGSINLSYVEKVAEDIGKVLRTVPHYHKKHIILKSTVVPTTTFQFANIIKFNSCEYTNFNVLYSPEFLAEGNAISDMLHPDKVVIGVEDGKTVPFAVKEMFEKVYGEEQKWVVTTWENAEMIKYANNAFLSTKISFINQIADMCEKIPNCDVNEVARALGYDSRISPLFLRAGLGYGGSCFTKDLDAISNFAIDELNVDPSLFSIVNSTNHKRRFIPVDLIREQPWRREDGTINEKTIAILGLSFKPNTDDIRDSPALTIIDSILKNNMFKRIKINVYDPQAADIERHGYGTRLVRCPSAKYALKGTDMAIICTEWDEFYTLEPDDFLLLMDEPIVIDGRRVLKDPERFIKAGIKYYGIGYGKHRETVS